MEEHTSTAGAGILADQAIPKANVPSAKYFNPTPVFEGEPNQYPRADVGPSPVQLHDQPPSNQLPPLPPKPTPAFPTVSPGDPEGYRPHVGGPFKNPPYSQQIPSRLVAPEIPPQAKTYPQPPSVHTCGGSASQYLPEHENTNLPHQKPVLKQPSMGEQHMLNPQGRQADHIQASGRAQSSSQQNLRSPTEDQYSTDQLSLGAQPPSRNTNDPLLQQNLKHFEASESYEGGNPLDRNLESIIRAQAETVSVEVGNKSSRSSTMVHIPYDPNLVCPMCNKPFRIGEIQKYRAHVKDKCTGIRHESEL